MISGLGLAGSRRGAGSWVRFGWVRRVATGCGRAPGRSLSANAKRSEPGARGVIFVDVWVLCLPDPCRPGGGSVLAAAGGSGPGVPGGDAGPVGGAGRGGGRDRRGRGRTGARRPRGGPPVSAAVPGPAGGPGGTPPRGDRQRRGAANQGGRRAHSPVAQRVR